MPPTFGNGKICYIEFPATDVSLSAEFYRRSFGWTVRQRGDGSTSFDDSVGEVSGTWVIGRSPTSVPGLIFHIMVDDVEVTLAAVVANGGEVELPIGTQLPEITARFRDPAGNVVGLYQHGE